MAPLRYAAKFDPFLSLDCAPTPSTLAQSEERKGSNFAIWQPCLQCRVERAREGARVDAPAVVVHALDYGAAAAGRTGRTGRASGTAAAAAAAGPDAGPPRGRRSQAGALPLRLLEEERGDLINKSRQRQKLI